MTGSRRSGRSVQPTKAEVEAPLPLVEAKIAIPRLRSAAVARPRIGRLLDEDDRTVKLVAAPAGYGKTTAVRAWCASLDAGLAWVKLDAVDNDPLRLWRYVATAVDRVRSGLGRMALQRLNGPVASPELAVDELMNGIAVYGEQLVLVLDDLHVITEPACIAWLDRALLQLPLNARLVLVTRTDPPLGLARLRAGGELTELRANALAFTAAEARELLVTRGRLELDDLEIEMLVQRTEGWVAALVLAGLWLKTVEDPASAVRAFSGEHQFVAEYLSSEVLASLDADRRSVLQGACVLGELTPELCDYVLERDDSRPLLDALEGANAFLQRLKRAGWYRIHPLFADFARAELAAVDPGAAERYHRRAAEWLEGHGMPVEALTHASAARDYDTVARILVEYHARLIRSGAGRTLVHWVRQIPDERIVAYPVLAASAALAAGLTDGDAAERRRLLGLAERAAAARGAELDPYTRCVALMAATLTIDNGVEQAVADSARAVELALDTVDDLVTGALAAHARALFFAGDLDGAASAATRSLAQPGSERRVPGGVHAGVTLALVALERGRIVTARTRAERARAQAGQIASMRTWIGASAGVAMGCVLLAEGHPAEAEHELVGAQEFFSGDVANVHEAWLLVLLARARLQRGRLDHAEEALSRAREVLGEITDAGVVPALADEVEGELVEACERARAGELLDSPTAAELSVLRLLATELSVSEIGKALFLSPNTIRTHMRALYRKLGVHTRADAVARATALGLLRESESPV